MDNRRYLDIIYEGFNKGYGSYVSRTRSSQRTLISFLLTLCLVGGCLYPLLPKTINKSNGTDDSLLKTKQRKVVQYAQLSAPPPIEMINTTPPVRKPPSAPKPIATKKFVKPVVKKDSEIDKEEYIPDQEDMSLVNPGTKDQEGDSIHQVAIQNDFSEIQIEYELEEKVEVIPESKQEPKPKRAIPVEDKLFTIVEEPAEFPGGTMELLKFLSENLVYPQAARENAIQGRVAVQFTVEKDGSISNIQVIRDIGGGCGEEAIRVISLMPKWKPARQATYDVRSIYNLPVTFKLSS